MSLCPIYCLYLQEEAWKKQAALAHFTAQEIPVRFFSGFQGTGLGLSADLAVDTFSDGRRSFIHANQLAAVLSHLALLRLALHDEADSFIVVEDDIVFADDFKETWPLLEEDLHQHAIQIAQLGYCSPATILTPITPRLSRCYYAFGSNAIWWTSAAALAAIQQVRPICEPWDTALIRRVFPFLSHAVASPCLCRERTAVGEWPSSVGLEHKPIL